MDLDGAQLVRQLAKVLHGASLTPAQHNVLGILKTWTADPFWGTGVPGAHRRDRTGSGSYEQGNAVAIMDALYPRLTHAIFDPWLDSSQYSQLARVNAINDIPRSQGSAYDGGWEGYLQRALLQAIGTAKHPYSENYCGQGSLAACQAALQGALQSTIDALTSSYGNDAKPADWTCSRSNPVSGGAGEGTGQVAGVRCNPEYDDITFNAIGVGTVPPMPWVNRPTFQQVVQYPVGR